ncbi:MAG: hypothetical protein ACPGSO_03095 [Vicingaceae bacterium]
MKNFILVISAIFLIACGNQKSANLAKEAPKAVSLYGKVVLKSQADANGEFAVPVLYFDDGDAYFINFEESKVEKKELEKHVFQEIEIVGIIKKGKTPLKSQYPEKEGVTIKEGKYIVVQNIL